MQPGQKKSKHAVTEEGAETHYKDLINGRACFYA